MKLRYLAIALALLCSAQLAGAQTNTTTTSRLGWDQDAPTLATAQGYQYGLYVDAAAKQIMAGVTCAGAASPFACVGSFPSTLTAGNHSLELTAIDIVSVPGQTLESLRSTVFPIKLIGNPNAPRGMRIVTP